MNKYGVEEEEKPKKGKTASADDGCPSCGGKVEQHGKVKICENEGSEPFEKKDDEE